MVGEKDKNSKKKTPNSEFDNFQNLLKRVLSTPKEKADRKQVETDRRKERDK